MSQLIDKLNRVAKTVPQPMGFRTAQPVSAKAQMLLIASLGQTENANGLADYITGADAVVARITKTGPEAKAMQKMVRSLPDIPWGAWLIDVDEKEVATIVEAGADFVVFPAASALSAIAQGDKVGKVLQVEPSLGEGLLRAINDLPVDAVLIANESKEESLTWQHLMCFQRAASLLAKPMLVSVPSKLTTAELDTLWGIGVDGVVVEVSKEQPVDRLKELRQAVGNLTSKRKRGKAAALLPSVKMEAPAETGEEEEEDEDD